MLYDAKIGEEYIIKDILLNDKELKEFLLSLGCYVDAKVMLIDKKRSNVLIKIKDARYSIDKNLARKILVEA